MTGAYAVIPLTQGKSAIIDVTSLPLIENMKWEEAAGYARCRRWGKPIVMMHRLIMGLKPSDGWEVDHKNMDKLDNRRRNLRRCTRAENNRHAHNARTVAPYRGLGFRKARRRCKQGRWTARISVNKKSIWLGDFKTPEDAAWAYDLAAVRYHGEFAVCNFILPNDNEDQPPRP